MKHYQIIKTDKKYNAYVLKLDPDVKVEDTEFTDSVYKDSKLWVRASATAIKCALPYFSKHQIKDAIMHLRKEHILMKREMNDSRFDRTNWYAFSDHGVQLMEEEYA